MLGFDGARLPLLGLRLCWTLYCSAALATIMAMLNGSICPLSSVPGPRRGLPPNREFTNPHRLLLRQSIRIPRRQHFVLQVGLAEVIEQPAHRRPCSVGPRGLRGSRTLPGSELRRSASVQTRLRQADQVLAGLLVHRLEIGSGSDASLLGLDSPLAIPLRKIGAGLGIHGPPSSPGAPGRKVLLAGRENCLSRSVVATSRVAPPMSVYMA